MLNRPIEEPKFFNKLKDMAQMIVCTDGAANHLREFDTNIKPECIVGDLDSLRNDTK